MKRSTLIICTVFATLGLSAFGYMNMSNSEAEHQGGSCNAVNDIDNRQVYRSNIKFKDDLFYNVDSRFNTTIAKEDLFRAQSIIDIVPKEVTESIEFYNDNEVTIFIGDEEVKEIGHGDKLNETQMELFQSTDYSTNIRISANFKKRNAYTDFLEDDYMTYYMTIVPENEATYIEGQDALFKYLRENSKETTSTITRDKLKPGKVNFTVTKTGAIEKVKLTSTSGYDFVDEALIELITKIPGEWEPASNTNGINVDQEFVFFFGLQGC
jgi:hypothetical protein